MTSACLACGADGLSPLAELGTSPALVGVVCDDLDSARRAPLGQLSLVVCQVCGHISNRSFDPSIVEYGAGYDNSLQFSPAFRAYATELAGRLVTRHGIHGGHVVEIGSGDGEFLAELCRLSGGSGVGYDPSGPSVELGRDVRLVPELYRPGQQLDRFELLVCRHVVEHLDDPAALLQEVRRSTPAGAAVYIEVPAGEFNLSPQGMWDFIHPHVSYFWAGSLRRLAQRCGFEVIDEGLAFGGQFRWVELHPGAVRDDPVPRPALADHLGAVAEFTRLWAVSVDAWRERIEERKQHGQRLALWGAGAKGVTFLNAVDRAGHLVVVDINPRKWGRYVPGTGHRIQPPEALSGVEVSAVLLMNPMYADEIASQLRDLGVRTDLLPV